jgi:uncharacterized membrane protein YecN with MAPEG domain
LLHAFGLSRSAGPSIGRGGGMMLTLISFILMGAGLIYAGFAQRL